MITRIQNSIFTKPTAWVLAIAFLSMSFKMNGEGEVTLAAGTSIGLTTASRIQSNMVRVGQIVNFRVQYDVLVDGKVVIPAGSMAKGQVVSAQRARGLGQEGFLAVEIKSVTAIDGQEIFLTSGNIYQEGDSKQTLAVLLGVLVCILFLTIKGKNAYVPSGYQVNAIVAANTDITVE